MANNVQVEGIDDNHRSGLLQVLIPPIEALQSVDITTSNYEAELGRAGGAVINVALRSGTNDLHGSLFEFNRTSATSARNVFALTKAQTVYNQFGFTAGGPIRRNRTFVFGDFQGTRDHRGDVTRVTIPTLAFRAGDLSASTTTIYDPATGSPDGTGREVFAGNVIPANRISPISQRLLQLIPSPTFAGLSTNFEKATTRVKNTDSFDVKVDHQFTPSDNVSVRYSFQEPRVFDPGLYRPYGGPKSSGFAGDGTNRTQSAAINYTRIFSPKLITELRLGFARYLNTTRQEDYGSTTSKDLGIPGINLDLSTSGLTTINIDGFSNPTLGFASNQPWKRGETNFNLVNNWTRVVGNHTVKWGADIRRLRDDLQAGIFNPRGQWTFGAGPTARNGDPRTSFANSFAAFLLDQPTALIRDLPSLFSSIRQTPLFTYVQDKWQISPKLTLDLGLRHELWGPPKPQFPGGFSNYDPKTNSLVLAGIGSNPMNLGRKTPWANFGPRFGVAYRWSDRTVLRGGYGISTIPFPDNSYAFNFPVLQNNAFNPVNSFSAAGSLALGFPPPRPAVIPPDGVITNAPDFVYDVVPLDLKEGYLQSWNVAVQRGLPWKLTFEAAYVGNHSVGVLARRNINAGLVPGAGSAGQPLNVLFGRRADTRTWVRTDTNYHSLQIKLDRRFAAGLLLTTAYTYGKAIDYSADNGGLFDNVRIRENRARSTFDRTHVLVQSYIYELPFGPRGRWLKKGASSWLLGGWQVNGIFRAQTGAPLNITFSATTLNAPGNSNRPNVAGSPELLHNVGRGVLWFDTSVFSSPPPNTFGNVGRNVLSGPGFVNLDLSVFRKFQIREGLRFELRVESFNFTNTPHFNNPATTFGGAGFGEVTTALQDQRQLQFGAKMVF
ncbi:MAG: TonB-dependent receptor [Acidobacteria bacterium]|nr:MAG: TonB-dependent receptor [Acidobacteriota bacterium]